MGSVIFGRRGLRGDLFFCFFLSKEQKAESMAEWSLMILMVGTNFFCRWEWLFYHWVRLRLRPPVWLHCGGIWVYVCGDVM